MFMGEFIPFFKMTGSGNDFIIIDNRTGIVAPEQGAELAKMACRRKLSVGADGLILIEGDPEVDFHWNFYNSDGSVAEMCGNGARCAARFCYLTGIVKSKEMVFRTMAGLIRAEVIDERVRVQIPGVGGVKLGINLGIGPGELHFANTGVPHVVFFLPDEKALNDINVVSIGRAIRFHEYFQPAGTNVNFACVKGIHDVVVRTYERGVEDETLACGTGSIAAAILSCATGKAEPPVRVKTRGGEVLAVYFDVSRDNDDEVRFRDVYLEGPALVVYEGRMWMETVKA